MEGEVCEDNEDTTVEGEVCEDNEDTATATNQALET